MIAGVPKVVWYASTCRSPPALLAEYGLDGWMRTVSPNEPLSMEP